MTRLTMSTLALLAATFGATAARAQGTARVSVAPESKLWIEGTSNLHGWSCKARRSTRRSSSTPPPPRRSQPRRRKRSSACEVKVPVKVAQVRPRRDGRQPLQGAQRRRAPEISYILATFEAAPGEAKDTFTLKTVGTLTVAGKENKIEMDVVATRLAGRNREGEGHRSRSR